MLANPYPTGRSRRSRLRTRRAPSPAVTAVAALALAATAFPAPAHAASEIPGWTPVPTTGVIDSFANGALLAAGPTTGECAPLRIHAAKSWKTQEVDTACGTVDGTAIARASATGYVVYRAAGSKALTLWTPRGRRLTVDVTGLAAPVRVQAVTVGGQVALLGDDSTSLAVWTPGETGLRKLPAVGDDVQTVVTDTGQVVTLDKTGGISRTWPDGTTETASLPDAGYTHLRVNTRGDVVVWGDLTVLQPLRVWTAATGTWRSVAAPKPWNCSNSYSPDFMSSCEITVAGFNSRQEILVGVENSWTQLPGEMDKVRPMGTSDASQEWHLISTEGEEVSSGLGSPRSFTDDRTFLTYLNTYSGDGLVLVAPGRRGASLSTSYIRASLKDDGTLIGPSAWIKNKVTRMSLSPNGRVTTWTNGVEAAGKTATVGGPGGSIVTIPVYGPEIPAPRRAVTTHLRLHTSPAAGSGSRTTMRVHLVTNADSAAPVLGPVVGTVAPTGPDSDVLVVLDPAHLPMGQPLRFALVSPGGDDALTVTTTDVRVPVTLG